MRKDVKEFIRMLQARGWFFQRTAGTGHIVMRYKPGGQIAVPSTPSDYRWKLNCQSDARKIEEKYGPYVLVAKEGKKVRGLDYWKPEPLPLPLTGNEQVPVAPDNYNYVPVTIKLTRREYSMSTLDREIIITALTEKMQTLEKTIGPHLKLFEEYTRIKAALHNLGRVEKPDEEKVEEFLKEKKDSVHVERRTRISNIELYQHVKEVMAAHGGRMGIKELAEWLRDVKGYDLGDKKNNLSANSDIVQRIKLYNTANPETTQLMIMPQKESWMDRALPCEYIMLKEEVTA